MQSRYYNPAWQRFANADNNLVQKRRLFSHNAYCYCVNNPIVHYDPQGTWPLTALIAGVSALVYAATGVAAAIAGTAAAPVAAIALGIATAVAIADIADKIEKTAKVVEGFAEVSEIVTATVREKEGIEDEDTYGVSVYVYRTKDDDQIVHYVGITNDVVRRKKEHGKRFDGCKMVVVDTGLTRQQARFEEQFLISMYTIHNLENGRREIAVRNLPKFTKYVRATVSLYNVSERFRIAMMY